MSHLEEAIRKILEGINGSGSIDAATKQIVELVGERGRRKRLSPARLNMLRRLYRTRQMNGRFAAGGLEHMICEALVDMGYADQEEQADRAGLMHYFAITELGVACIKMITTAGYEMRD